VKAYCWTVALFVMVMGLGILAILATLVLLNCGLMGQCGVLEWRFFAMAAPMAAGFAVLGFGLMKLIGRP
jgi:hypothetical protein